MALVIRPLIAEFSAQHSEIPTQMNAYCALMMGVETKFSSTFPSDGTEAIWEDVIIFHINSKDNTMMRVVVYVEVAGAHRIIGETNIDLMKFYVKQSKKQIQRATLHNIDSDIGEIVLTIQYNSNKQAIQKLKRKLAGQNDAPVIKIPTIQIKKQDKSPNVVPTASVMIWQTMQQNSLKESVCVDVGQLGFDNPVVSNQNFGQKNQGPIIYKPNPKQLTTMNLIKSPQYEQFNSYLQQQTTQYPNQQPQNLQNNQNVQQQQQATQQNLQQRGQQTNNFQQPQNQQFQQPQNQQQFGSKLMPNQPNQSNQLRNNQLPPQQYPQQQYLQQQQQQYPQQYSQYGQQFANNGMMRR